MGKRGPKREPDAVQEVKGNPSKRPGLRAGVSPQLTLVQGSGVKAPPAPRWLSDHGKRLWKKVVSDLVALGLYQDYDEVAFAVLVETYAEWRAVKASLKRRGVSRIQKFKNGVRQVAPEHTVERQLRNDLMQYLAQFGMTPSGRAGLHVTPKDEKVAARAKQLARIEARKQRNAANKKGGG